MTTIAQPMKVERIPLRVTFLGLLLVANMLLAGCTSLFDDSKDSNTDGDNELKDVSTLISRSVGNPELIGFDN